MSSFRLISSCISSSVASTIASASLLEACVAPRAAQSRSSSLIARIFPEALDLVAGEPACAPLRQIAELERADPDSGQRLHLVPEGLRHSAELSLAPLADRDHQVALALPLDSSRRRQPLLELAAGAQPLPPPVGGRPGEPHPVGLRYLVARMGEAIGELAVVGQQDQARRVGIEAANRIEAPLRVDQLRDRAPAAGLLRGGHD